MDFVSHGIWGGLITKKKLWYIGFLFGAFPDIIGYIGRLFQGDNWTIYHYSHSVFICAIVFVFTYFALRALIYGLPYLVHCVMDIPAHPDGTSNFFYVPFTNVSLDPFHWSGWGWWKVEFVNYFLLIAVLVYILNDFYGNRK